ncbi:MAG TPA: universal stress protein [Ktedonobacterales bacterium]|nr:universal stress protein [Ktedonobacterales bacterium]
MFHRILVPLDGSARAERALPVAARLARAMNGTLVLVRVAQPPLQPPSFLAPPLEVEANMLSKELEQAATYLAQVMKQVEIVGVGFETVSLVGYPAEMILEAAQTHRADSIILTSHGRTGLLRWVLGSVAQRVIYQATVPVLVLHQQGPLPLPESGGALRALVPLDGSGLAEAMIGPAATLVSALASQGKGIIHLARVTPASPREAEASTPTPREVGTREAALREAEAYLSRAAENLREGPLAHLHVTWSALANKDVAGALVDLAQQGITAQGSEHMGRFDLMAMSTHGRGGLRRLVMGSVTERVLSGSKLPLLVMRPKEVAANQFNVNQTGEETIPMYITEKGPNHV